MKRQYRELALPTKQKISQALRGKRKSATHREKISLSMKRYWQSVPYKESNNENENPLNYEPMEETSND